MTSQNPLPQGFGSLESCNTVYIGLYAEARQASNSDDDLFLLTLFQNKDPNML